jgi:glycosyltransferase involved in cell wall biosynthesis
LPRVSIGLPVWNGENYLAEAVASILGQTYQDFELILSDNGSTDGTAAICRRYVAEDARVRYHRFDENQGAGKNFNFVFAEARGEYFKWAAHDDVLGPEYLSLCVETLDRDPLMVLCHTRSGRIDAEGRISGSYTWTMRLDSPHPRERFRDLIIVRHNCVAIFGVMRREVLAKTGLIGNYVASDRVLLAELSLHGKLYEIPETHFYRRDHPLVSSGLDERTDRLAWFDPGLRPIISFPHWRIVQEYGRALRRADLPWRERLACWTQLPGHLMVRRSHLWRDLAEAFKALLNRSATCHKIFLVLKRILKSRAASQR